MKFIKKAKRGFTLVELVVVIAVIAILAAVSVGAYFGITDSANKSKLESEARGILTNIQLIANGNDSNSYMNREAVHIKEVDAFERKLNGMSGIDYEVTAEMPTSISKETVYLINTKEDQPSNSANDTFGTYYRFGYYTPDVGGKCAIYTFATQEVKITDANFEVNKDEGGNEGGETATPVESINVTGVGSSIELHVNELSPQILVTWEPQEAQIEYRYDSSVISWDTSFIKGLKAGSTNFEIVDKANGVVKHSIAVTVKEKTAEGLTAISGSAKTNYFTGDVFEINSLKLGVVYSDSPTPVEIKDTENIKYSTEPLTKSGNVILSYVVGTKELTYTIAVTVTSVQIEEFVYTGEQITKQFYVGDTFDLTDLTFRAEYNDSRKNKENLTLSDVQVKDTELSLGKNYVSYEYEGLECKISIPAVKEIEITGLEYTYDKTLGDVPTYNVNTTLTTQGFTFTPIFDKEGYVYEDFDVNDIICNQTIESDTKTIKFGYEYNGKTVYTEDISIKVVEKKQIYFIDQYWWNQTDSKTFIKLYDNAQGEGQVGNGGYGTQMQDVDDTFYLTVGKVSTIEIDVHGATHAQLFRVKNDLTSYNSAKTEIFSLDNLKDNNAILLETSPKWDNADNGYQLADVSFETYNEHYYRPLHIVGLGSEENAWDHSEANKFEYDHSTKTYTLENVNLEYHDEFLLKEVHSDEKDSPFNKLIKYNDIQNKILNTDFALSAGSNDNIKVGHSAAGVYDITINAEGKINFTKVDENFNIEIRGRIHGDEGRWSNNPISSTERNNDVVFFNDVKLQENDRFKIFASDYDGFEYNFKNVTEKPAYFVAKDNSDKPDILLTEVDGIFDITVNIKEDTVVIEEVSSEHVCREYDKAVTPPTCTTDGYTTYTCKSCGNSHTADTIKAGGHNYTEKLVQPTCTEDGYTLHTCTSCDDSYKTNIVSKKGHNYQKTEHKADCQNEGYTTYKCTVCNYSYNGDKVNKTDCDFNGTAPFACKYNCGHHDTDYIFLKPNGNWKADNAKFAAYFFGNSGEKWVMMTKISDDYYYAKLPANYDKIIFCRMNTTGYTGWDNKWNQTEDLTAAGNQGKCYQVKDGTWDNGGGTWLSTWL